MGAMVKLSVLDVVPVAEGSTVSQALANAADLALHAEKLGYHRYWTAEHHGMPGIASAATSVVLAHIGAATKSIRIGAGGIMLPNHAPLAIAEQFGTLDALFPGRVDLGLGRAPGSDQHIARALRRTLAGGAENFPQDVLELQACLAGDPRLGFEAVPGAGSHVPLWILGSSLFGAQLAAHLGLPYAFASHFAPDALDEALHIYRRDFKPSEQLREPLVMAGYNVFAADTQEEAQLLATSMMQSYVAIRSGQPTRIRPPIEGYYETLPPPFRSMFDNMKPAWSIGTKEDVARDLSAFVRRTRADEIIINGMIYDPAARRHSFALAMEAARQADILTA